MKLFDDIKGAFCNFLQSILSIEANQIVKGVLYLIPIVAIVAICLVLNISIFLIISLIIIYSIVVWTSLHWKNIKKWIKNNKKKAIAGGIAISSILGGAGFLLFNGEPPAADTGWIYAHCEDGTVIGSPEVVWDDARSTGTNVYNGTNSSATMQASYRSKTGDYVVYRSFFKFDTSSVPDICCITNVEIGIYGFINGGHNISIQKGTHGDGTLVAGNFNAYSGSYYDTVDSWSNSAYNTFTLNTQGRSDINKKGSTYYCLREYTHDYLDSAPTTGYKAGCHFSEEAGTTKDPRIKITYTLSEANPVINITYAGNTSYSGGPKFVPPAIDNTTLANDGYFVNGSCIPENEITIKANVTDVDGINSVVLHLYNMTTDVWDNKSSMNFNSGNEYTINKSGFLSNHQYSFDIYAEDACGASNTATWYKNKTSDPSTLIRRSVFLNCTPDNDAFEYTPFYTTNISSDEFPNVHSIVEKRDAWYHDQYIGSHCDRGVLLKNEPTSDTQWTRCGAAIWLPIDWQNISNNISINETIITNVYVRNWWSNNTIDINSTENNFGINRTKGASPFTNDEYIVYSSSDARAVLNISDLTSSNWIADFVTHIQLATCSINVSNSSKYTFDSNDIYELFFIQNGTCPSTFSNRSYMSYLLFNVPNNTTLQGMDTDGDNLNDYNELFLNYTSPFHADTDGDGDNDDVEIAAGTNPNIWTDFSVAPNVTNPVPVNGTGVASSPTLEIDVDDENGGTIDVYWLSNSSSSWVQFGVNMTVDVSGSGNVTLKQSNSNFTESGVEYYWSVNATDGVLWTNNTYHFTIQFNTTVRTNGEDYFVWLGANQSAWHVKDAIGATFNEAGETISVLNNTGHWDNYTGTGSGNNFSIHTFDIVKIVLDNGAGTLTFNMTTNSNIDYTSSRTVNLTKIGNGYNFTGWTNSTSTTLSAENTTLALATGYFIALWNETNYAWDYWISGWWETDKDILQYDVVMTKIATTKSDWQVG